MSEQTEKGPLGAVARPRFGTGLPSFLPGPPPQAIAEYALAAERLGFESVWLPEHLLRPATLHAHSFLDPLVTLAFVAGMTSVVRLGTAALLLPLRNPVLLAKEVASLQHLAAGRLVLGVATGWNRSEFEALGVAHSERGQLATENLRMLQGLLDPAAPSAVHIEPLSYPTEIWVGGGSQVQHDGAVGGSLIAPSVARRIASSNGWLVRSTSSIEQMSADLMAIEGARAAMSDLAGDNFTVAYKAYVHVVPDLDSDAAIAAQLPAFREFSGQTDDVLLRLHLLGSVDDIVQALLRRVRAGCTELIIAPITADPGQLELIAGHSVPAVLERLGSRP